MEQYLNRIELALSSAKETVSQFTSGQIESELKAEGDPVTAADVALDNTLREFLLEDDEGWLSEETADDLSRLDNDRVWIVDPLDGTREFIEGIPEWCISVGFAVKGRVVAAGIYNPPRDQLFLGAAGMGVTLNGRKVSVSRTDSLQNARILASRSEIKRGEWDRFMNGPFEVVPSGSVAYKLASVSAGLADATFTLVPKNEWDIAAGVLLVEAAGGKVLDKEGNVPGFNHRKTLLPGLVACGGNLFEELARFLGITPGL